jgi:hypothetical protein
MHLRTNAIPGSMAKLERRRPCRDTIAAPPLRTRDRRAYTMALTNISHGNSLCMTEYLIAARAVLILWTNLAVMPAGIVFDAIEAELQRRGIEP